MAQDDKKGDWIRDAFEKAGTLDVKVPRLEDFPKKLAEIMVAVEMSFGEGEVQKMMIEFVKSKELTKILPVIYAQGFIDGQLENRKR